MVTRKQKVYKYEHTNGSIIEKPAIVVDTAGGPLKYFDSPFVIRWWEEETESPAYPHDGD